MGRCSSNAPRWPKLAKDKLIWQRLSLDLATTTTILDHSQSFEAGGRSKAGAPFMLEKSKGISSARVMKSG